MRLSYKPHWSWAFLYALALALFLSFRCWTLPISPPTARLLGAAVSVTPYRRRHPCWLFRRPCWRGACAGSITAFLQTRLWVPSILAGIVTNTGLYTINLHGWAGAPTSLLGGTPFLPSPSGWAVTGMSWCWPAETLCAPGCSFLGTRPGTFHRSQATIPYGPGPSLDPHLYRHRGGCLSNG